MKRIILSFQVAGCPSHCFHCHCCANNNSRALLNVDTVLKIASEFRKNLAVDTPIYLLDEQTYHPDFIKLVKALESEGFTRNDASKTLVTNCWGLVHTPGLIDEIKKHFSLVKPTLFGIRETHDIHVGRKGSYDEIIQATKKCIENGINVAWQLMWTRLNTKELDSLYQIGENIGVKNIYITGEYFYTGNLHKHADKFLPLHDDLELIKHDIYEYKQGYLKTIRQFAEDIKSGKTYHVEKVSFDELYIDKELNVYPLCHVSQEFLLGNLRDSSNNIIEQIKNGTNLSESIQYKRKQEFEELVLNYGDVASNQLYTPQSLFDKLCLHIM